MDLLAYLASIEHRADAVIDNAAALKDEVEQARALYLHQLEQWCEKVRTPVAAVLPSQLPDRTLGPHLTRVRDFLCRAPGQPVDPEFDRVVAVLGGISGARRMVEHSGLFHQSADFVWQEMRAAAASRTAMERAE